MQQANGEAAGPATAVIVRDLTAAATAPHQLTPGKVYATVTPEGARVFDTFKEQAEIEHRTTRQRAVFHQARSLADWAVKRKTAQTELWADEQAHAVAVVLDADPTADTVPNRFSGRWAMRRDATFDRWVQFAGEWHTRDELAEWLRSNRRVVVSPSAADLLEIVQRLELSKNVTFTSAKRLTSGAVVAAYSEQVTARAGSRGEFEIPPGIAIATPIIVGSPPVEVVLDLRYRLADGELLLKLDLDHTEELVHEAFGEAVEAIATATGLTALWGVPGISVGG